MTAAHSQWLASDGKNWGHEGMKWFLADDAARRAGQPPIPKPSPPSPEPPAEGNPGLPTSLFNGNITPLQPFAIKGTIW